MKLFIGILATTFSGLFLAQDKPAPAEKVALCDVMKQPEAFSQRRLSMPGIVMGSNAEKLLIMWPECQFGMHLVISSNVQSHADVQALFRAVRQGNPGTTDRDITRRFTGVFYYSAVGSVYELRVEKVEAASPYKDPNF